MTIRVTPIGGEPVELPEETEAVGTYPPFGTATAAEYGGDVELTLSDGSTVMREPVTLAVVAGIYIDAFVHIGDAWPLCEIETWRARAERLERELAAVRMQLWAANALHPPENDRLAMDRWKAGQL